MKFIAAVDKNWAIGNKGRLLARISEDQKNFRKETMGHVVVLGRKTLEEFPGGKPLKGRKNIILSRNSEYSVPDAVVVHSIDELFKEIWPPIIRLAEEKGVKVAIENCPMLFGRDQWPGGQNLFTTPKLWRTMFELLPSDNFGINYDPSHFIWQHIDYIKPLYEFKDKIFHVHYKDIKLYPDKLDDVGIMAYPLEYMSPKLPGLGDVDWGRYVSALTDIGYNGCTCVEVEDKSFEGSRERVLDSVKLSYRYMRQFVI